MDPYLQEPALWPEFHRQFVAVLSEILVSGLAAERYQVVMGKWHYATADSQGGEGHQEDYLDIRQRSDACLVTRLDVVSPANKTTPTGRQAYLERRRKALDRGANCVEIDLVLQGQPTLHYTREGLPEWDYAVTVTRRTHPERYEIYTATLQKRLPSFRLSLASDDVDNVVDLQLAFTRCYAQGGYLERLNYRAEPAVPLGEEDRHWLDATLSTQGLREPSPPHEQVALAAYRLWEQEGRPHGHDKEHWQAALRQLRAEGGPTDSR